MVPVRNAVSGPGTIALSIDDGPTAHTPALLDCLGRRGMRANFFVLGRQVAAFPELAGEIVARGHGLFNHSFDHPSFAVITEAEASDQIARTETLLSAIRPAPSPYPLRLPFGEGLSEPKVHAAITAFRQDAVLYQSSISALEWNFVGTFASMQEVQAKCREAVAELGLREWSERIVMTHDWEVAGNPRLSPDPFAPAICLELLEQFADWTARKNLRTVVLGERPA